MSEPPILVGDSIFRRLFAEHRELFSPVSLDTCKGGKRILEVYDIVRQHRIRLIGKDVVLMVGTNDLLEKSSLNLVRQSYRVLVRYLKRLKCRLTLCEILPIPKFGQLATDCNVVLEFNKYVRSFEPSGVKVIRTHDQFVNNNQIRLCLFHKTFFRKGKGQCVDLVHPNTEGLHCLLLCIEA